MVSYCQASNYLEPCWYPAVISRRGSSKLLSARDRTMLQRLRPGNVGGNYDDDIKQVLQATLKYVVVKISIFIHQKFNPYIFLFCWNSIFYQIPRWGNSWEIMTLQHNSGQSSTYKINHSNTFSCCFNVLLPFSLQSIVNPK